MWLQILLIQAAWVGTSSWLVKVLSPDLHRVNLVDAVNSCLDSLCWLASLTGFKFDDACGIGTLSRIMSLEWLSGDNVNILVEFLQEDAARLGVSMHFLGRY